MIVKTFLVNAFSDGLFSGGQAGVVILRHLGQEVYLQALAEELGWPVTSYVLPHDDHFMVRYFTPGGEIDRADYAALATGHILYGIGLAPASQPLTLLGRGGRSLVSRDLLTPARLALNLGRAGMTRPPAEPDLKLAETLGLPPAEVLSVAQTSRLTMICCRNLADLDLIKAAPVTRLVLSAAMDIPGGHGYAARCFTPAGELKRFPLELDMHARLAPFWAARLGASRLEIHHLAARPGLLWAEAPPGGSEGEVLVSGYLKTIVKGEPVLEELTHDSSPELSGF
ncbi:MAG: PhzF family phenazine biosynthesis protein [Candidatus Adiutrix sp.]|jgi:predicted PhzF superfamily epimerase YddE/YHI9|nr:PhzF family phenazine biosynthesis protein [Candidatus Adiutrix sp.]